MAKYVIPPKHDPIVKCRKCGTMYVPDQSKYSTWQGHVYEECPHCKYYGNTKYDLIPLWKYNLIKFIRGGFKE